MCKRPGVGHIVFRVPGIPLPGLAGVAVAPPRDAREPRGASGGWGSAGRGPAPGGVSVPGARSPPSRSQGFSRGAAAPLGLRSPPRAAATSGSVQRVCSGAPGGRAGGRARAGAGAGAAGLEGGGRPRRALAPGVSLSLPLQKQLPARTALGAARPGAAAALPAGSPSGVRGCRRRRTRLGASGRSPWAGRRRLGPLAARGPPSAAGPPLSLASPLRLFSLCLSIYYYFFQMV